MAAPRQLSGLTNSVEVARRHNLPDDYYIMVDVREMRVFEVLQLGIGRYVINPKYMSEEHTRATDDYEQFCRVWGNDANPNVKKFLYNKMVAAQEKDEAATIAAAREKALQELSDLCQELGLYD